MKGFNKIVVRRSARLAACFRPERAKSPEAVGPPGVVSRACTSAAPVKVSASSRAPHRAVPVRKGGDACAGVRSQGISLRAVRVNLVRCDETLGRTAVRRSEQASEINNKIDISSAIASEPPQTHQVDSASKRQVDYASERPPRSSNRGGNVPVPALIGSTGVRILQLNMRRSIVVTGEVRSLVSPKRLDVLLLQELNVRKRGQAFAFIGLGTGMRVAAVTADRPWAAVAVCNPAFQILLISQLSTTHCACAEVRAPGFSFYAVSCYFQYSEEIEEHLRHLAKVFRFLRGERILVGMDANARSPLWGDRKLDEKGAKLQEFIRACGCNIINVAGQPPTYWTSWGSSHIDVTLASPSMTQFIGDWKVRADWTSSDHRSVDIRLRVPRVKGEERRTQNARFDTNRADWERFATNVLELANSRLELAQLESAEEVDRFANLFTGVLVDSCIETMPKKRQFRKSNPWWTKELTILKKTVYRKRRDIQKERVESTRLEKWRVYRTSLRRYTAEVRKTRLESWQKFVTKVGNSEPWGFVYKHQAKKLRVDQVLSTLRDGNSSTTNLEETARRLLDVHVPNDREEEDTPEQRVIRESARIEPDCPDAQFFTGVEVSAAVRALKNKKAPGLDLIEVSAVKAAYKVIPGQFLRLFNGCLQWGVFPSAWKEGSLRVFLKKEDGDVEDPKSYRPICLLPVIGKLFEKLLMKRLRATSLAPGRVSDRQFGFTPERSTEDAIVELRRVVSSSEGRYVIALLFDISGAFDNVWWPLVLENFKTRNCPRNIYRVLQNYFESRKVSIAFGDIGVCKQATRGCPQGSVLGPACWNIMFDGLLETLESAIGQNFVAYADDLIVVVNGDSRREIESKGQHAVSIIENWCRGAKLQVSSHKTEAIVLRSELIKRAPVGRRGGARPDRKRKALRAKKSDIAKRLPTIRVGNANIKYKKAVRYLGIYLDREMGVSTHCKYLNDKVGSLFYKLGRLARCRWGLRFGTLSAIYRGVFIPSVAYAAAGWADLCVGSDFEVLRTLQRRVLISVTSAYRTASTESLCVTAGAAPIDILLAEYRARYYVRKQKDAEIGSITIPFNGDKNETLGLVRAEARGMWQDRWSSSVKGRITSAFFRSIEERLGATWVKPDHCVTQFLTGHGNFRGRKAALGLVESGVCACCGDPGDTAPHHLLECSSFEPQRVALRSVVPVGEWRWPEVAPFLVSSPEVFSLFADFCQETLWLKGN